MGCGTNELNEIFEATRDAAYHIIERKGATFYAIAAGLGPDSRRLYYEIKVLYFPFPV